MLLLDDDDELPSNPTPEESTLATSIGSAGLGHTIQAMSHAIHLREVEFSAIRSQGPGGQNVNKVSSAVHLRFDIRCSSLPDAVKDRLLQSQDQRITKEGIIVIKAQSSRSRDQNKTEALARLEEIIARAAHVLPPRRPTKPTQASKRRRLEAKSMHANIKAGRGKVAL